MQTLTLYSLGKSGVNVDRSDFHMDDSELREASNIIQDPLGKQGGLRNRPGLTKFNTVAAAGAILGGIGVPLINLVTGTRFLYIGRGPVS